MPYGIISVFIPIAVILMAITTKRIIKSGSCHRRGAGRRRVWGTMLPPLGETVILSATIADVPVLEHVKSELPFSLTGIGISAVLLIIFAYLS